MKSKSHIPYGKQDVTQDDIDAVINVLKSEFLTQGPCVPQFEKEVSKYCSVKYAVAVNSATSALHLACLSLGLVNGDWLWTSPITFVASANCGLYCGAKVDFVDIDPATYNLCPNALKRKLIQAKELGKLPKVVVAVHLCGQSCDMKALYALSKEYGFKIIEDASHAIGGKYRGDPIGNCHYSDITVFSFHPVKIITAGEGGMALTNDAKLAEHMRLLRSHSITRDVNEMTHKSDGPWYYQQIDLGYNYRMTDIHAALGLSQMKRLDELIIKRHTLAKKYEEALSHLPVTIPWQHSESYSAFHLYVIRLKLTQISMSQREVFEVLHSANIGVNLHYIPVYRQPYYEQFGFKKGYCPNAEGYYAEAISIPIFPGMKLDEQDYIVNTITELVK